MRSFAALSLATAALAFPSNIEERNLFPHPSIPNVAYMLDNDPNGCNIISFHIFQNGSIGEPLRTPTGGLGAMSYCRGLGCGNQGDLFPVDDLGSQGAVKVSGNMLFTVNAGSSELSLFEINPFDPYRPKHIHNIDTMGDFPMSVDYSPKLRQACVLNGGTRAGISCFTVDLLLGMRPSGPLREQEKSLYNQTKYASGDFNTTGQILFNPDSTGVFATIKGNGFFPPYTPGSLVAWPIKNGKVSTGPYVLNQFDDIHMDFGFLFIKKDRVMITDPSSGVVFMDISPDLKASIFVHTIIAGNLLSCWTAWSPSLNTLYSMDGAKNNIYLLNPQTGAHFANITVKPEVPANYSGATEGTYDAIIAQNGILYTLAYTNGMFAVDTKTRKQTQYYDLSFMGDRTHWQGLAQWPEQKLPV